MGYQPPLRSAVIFLMGLNAGAVSPRTVAELTEIPEDRSKAFFSILEKCKIVKTDPDGFVPGRKWSEWIRKPCRSKSRSTNSMDFVIDSQKIKNVFALRVRYLMESIGINQYQLAQRAGIPAQYIYKIQEGKIPPVPQTIRIAKALQTTVEELTT